MLHILICGPDACRASLYLQIYCPYATVMYLDWTTFASCGSRKVPSRNRQLNIRDAMMHLTQSTLYAMTCFHLDEMF